MFKNNQKTWMIIGGSTFLIIIGLILCFRKKKEDVELVTFKPPVKPEIEHETESKKADSNTQVSQTDQTDDIQTISVSQEQKQKQTLLGHDEFPLRLGSQGERVKAVQVWLNTIFHQEITMNGIFDLETEQALMTVKHRNNISEEYWKKINFNQFL